jgi:hypothetical protein
VDQPIVPNSCITGEFSLLDTKWFEANAARFERILYHIGNSPECKYMFTLLEREPGVVALHDFHLGGVLNWMEETNYVRGSFTKALYESHGFAALDKDRVHGREKSIRVFPCNAAVLRNSFGIIAHGDDLGELARTWYGETGLPAITQLPAIGNKPGPGGLDSTAGFEKIAEIYRDFIEETYATSARAREKNLIQAIASVPAPVQASDADLETVASAVAANRERFGRPQILVDVTILASQDARTGIQRVTRGILMALITDPPPGYRVEAVRSEGDLYLYARRFTSECLGLEENVLLAAAGVSFFALELIPRITRAQSMDVLSSRATISGYEAVLLAAASLP